MMPPWFSLSMLLLLPFCFVASFMPGTARRTRRSAGRKFTAIAAVDESLATIVATGSEQLQNLAASLATGQVSAEDFDDIMELGTSLFRPGVEALKDVPVEARVAAFLAPVVWYIAPILRSEKKPDNPTYPEQKPATYEMSSVTLPFEFGDAAFVRPLLKQTQLEFRPLQVAYDARRDGYNARTFHKKVDGKGAAVVLAKAGGKWFGGYNPRGWASLGGSRPSIAAFLFYKTLFGWQKLRAKGNGGNSCSSDLFDRGIYLGSEGLSVPLDGEEPRRVTSRLGFFFETGPSDVSTLLPIAGQDARLQELKVLVGVYEKDEDIPNSGGVLDLGLY